MKARSSLVVAATTMSRALNDGEPVLVSKWVVPDVAKDANDHELVSEASLAALRQKRQEEGYAEGVAAGLAEGREQVEARIRLFEQLAEHLAEPIARLEPIALQSMVKLSTQIARVLIDRELSIDNSLVLSAVAAGLETITESGKGLKIRVNPNDFELVRSTYCELNQNMAVEVTADASVAQGGAIIEAGSALIDAQIETRLAVLLESILNPPEIAHG